MTFIDKLQNTLNDEYNYSTTENGALGYRTTGKALLDLNFSVASLRGANQKTIERKFFAAYAENKELAFKWLFYARDVREGLGERRLFRIIVKDFCKSNYSDISHLIKFIPEYGRFDDLLELLDTSAKSDVINLIDTQLTTDLENMRNNKPISLLAKWLPSINTSSKESVAQAKIIIKALGMTQQQYRKALSAFRKYLNVVEVKMTKKEWNDIDYKSVPSRANLIYNSAFLRNDEDRRREFLSKLEKGETTINAGTLYPHDIVAKYYNFNSKDVTLEELWKALPNTVNGCGNTIVVADGSGSMTNTLSHTNVTALDVANALSIYFSERSSGEFKDKYITFSEQPKLVDFSNLKSLRDKLRFARQHDEVANTNIEAVFELILKTAINNHSSQEDIPANILIISDMEFDDCAVTNSYRDRWSYRPDYNDKKDRARLFTQIAEKYNNAGYKLPRLIFWNVNSRTSTIPVIENELGVALVSGFSVNIAKMIMSGKTDPYECLVETLMSERYSNITTKP